MPGLNQFTGSPWHKEKMVREDGDPRRHRGKCKFYNKETRYCAAISSNCFGAAHCGYYKERPQITKDDKTSGNWRPKVQKVDKYAQYNKKKNQAYKKKVSLTVGSKVKDPTYGEGVVKNIYNGLAIVNFKNVGDVLMDTRTNSKSGTLHKVEKKNGRYGAVN